jgi:molecular chaperone DnaJ
MTNDSNNVQVQLELTLEEIFSGVKKKIHYKRKEACSVCNSSSKSISQNSCHHCKKTGFLMKEHSVDVEIPAGVGTGMTLSLNEKGHEVIEKKKLFGLFKSSNQKKHGNLLIQIEEQNHATFSRNGADLVIQCRLTEAELASGLTTEIQLLEKSVIKIQIPPGTQDGRILRIQGKGLPNLQGNTPGNLLILVKSKAS